MCISPISITVADTGNRISVPCGKCIDCLGTRRIHWSFRLQEELRYSDTAGFITLTYEDFYLPCIDVETNEVDRFGTVLETEIKRPGQIGKYSLTLYKPDLTLFLKRLREANRRWYFSSTDDEKVKYIASEPSRFKYYAIGEYGDKFNRPHYHIILFNLPLNFQQNLNKYWEYGMIHLGTVNQKSINYITAYVVTRNKKTKVQDEYAVMSKGLGEKYMLRNYDLHKRQLKTSVRWGKGEISLPRYYKDRIFNVQEKEQIHENIIKKIDTEFVEKTQNDENLQRDYYLFLHQAAQGRIKAAQKRKKERKFGKGLKELENPGFII